MCGRNVWILLAVSLILTGCPCSHTSDDTTDEGPLLVREDELFVSYEIEEGLVQTKFSTNDTQYSTLEGLTIWTVWGDEGDIFTSRTVSMVKTSGHSDGGFGIVFCQGEHAVNGAMQSVMLVVMINAEGQYIIGKVVGDVFSDYVSWKTTQYLNRNIGAGNEIKVSYEEETGEYRLDINGNFIERFRDEDEPVLLGGKNGYAVVITPSDKFPETSVEVYFTEEK